MPNAKKRLSIDKIKKHKFFNGIQWADVESGKCRVPRVLLKEPKAENFDEISYDSDDEDFAHEFQSYEDASKPNQNQNIDLKVSNVESSVRGEEVKENDLLTEIQFAHLKEEKPNQDSKGGQLRLPTTINFRDKSVCLS